MRLLVQVLPIPRLRLKPDAIVIKLNGDGDRSGKGEPDPLGLNMSYNVRQQLPQVPQQDNLHIIIEYREVALGLRLGDDAAFVLDLPLEVSANIQGFSDASSDRPSRRWLATQAIVPTFASSVSLKSLHLPCLSL